MLGLNLPGVVTTHSDAIGLCRKCTGGNLQVNCGCPGESKSAIEAEVESTTLSE